MDRLNVSFWKPDGGWSQLFSLSVLLVPHGCIHDSLLSKKKKKKAKEGQGGRGRENEKKGKEGQGGRGRKGGEENLLSWPTLLPFEPNEEGGERKIKGWQVIIQIESVIHIHKKKEIKLSYKPTQAWLSQMIINQAQTRKKSSNSKWWRGHRESEACRKNAELSQWLKSAEERRPRKKNIKQLGVMMRKKEQDMREECWTEVRGSGYGHKRDKVLGFPSVRSLPKMIRSIAIKRS